METTLRKPVPFGVYLVAAFYLFGALVLVLGTLTGLVDARMAIARAHGLPAFAGTAFVFLLTSLIMGALDFPVRGEGEAQVYFGNLLWSVLVVVYLLLVRRRFLGRE